MPFLKVVLPVVGGVLAVSNLMLLVNPTAFFETVGMGSIVAETETPLAKSLIVNHGSRQDRPRRPGRRLVLQRLRDAGPHRHGHRGPAGGVDLRRRRDPARVRARQAGPRDGRARPARPHEPQVPRQAGLVVPLLVALAAHLAEPGLLTKDKSKDQ